MEFEHAEREKVLKRKIYLDNAATTAVRPEVEEAMRPYFCEQFGNPSGLYEFATANLKAIKKTRENIAEMLNCNPEEIYFTSGGTESDNWAIKGICAANSEKGKHIITSRIEHHAVLNTCRFLEKLGYEVTYLNVDENGFVNLNELRNAVRQDTVLISVMAANNEIGTLQPLREIGSIAAKSNIVFHTDAVQAFGQIELDVKRLNIDLLSASAHKFGGPKGVGFLYVKEGIDVEPLLHGGGQERKLRSGTENVAGIVGMGKACELLKRNFKERTEKERVLRDYLIKRVIREIPYSRLNGSVKYRLPGNANFSFQYVDGSSLVIMLDMEGISVSSASACSAGSGKISHVLEAIWLPEDVARGSLRITLCEDTTVEEIDETVEVLKRAVEKIRSM